MHKTTLYLPETTRRRLRDMSRRTGRPQADLVRQALEGYLSSEETPLPGSIGSGADKDLSGRDTEDWLRANWRPR
jgi:predicted transcriptional regulator